jgi:RNA polymerase sigma-70 factor (ECF subfamily)
MEASTAIGRPARAAAGDLPAAFERLFIREYGRVAAIAYRVLGDAAEAEDVAQDVFIAFYRRHDPEASYAPSWLYAAAAHSALNVIRGRARRERRESRAATHEGERVADPEAEAIAAEERALVRATLVGLPEQAAALLALRYSGLSYAECATALGVRIDQVGTRLRRAQDAFRKEVLHDQQRPR